MLLELEVGIIIFVFSFPNLLVLDTANSTLQAHPIYMNEYGNVRIEGIF
jgi:hypothetical protein